jgi:hypothetical protein
MSKRIEGRLTKLERRTAEPQPDEVAYAMIFHEHNGKWPIGTQPQVRKLAERLMDSSAEGMAIFDSLAV